MFLNVIIAGCGGFIGAAARFLISSWSSKIFPTFPVGILLINFVGCFLMGFITIVIPHYFPEHARLMTFLTTGCLGGFTTLSTFGLDTWNMFTAGHYLPAIINVVLTLLVCFIGIISGISLGKVCSH